MENRERILNCALTLFYKKGYDAVGIQEICQAAGVTKPTLYHYFGSKYGLLETLLDSKYTGFIEALETAADGQKEIGESLYAYATVMIDFVNTEYEAYMLLMAMTCSAKESEAFRAVRPYLSRLYRLAVQLFETAVPALGNMNGRQEQFAIGFLGLIDHSILFQAYQEPGKRVIVSEEKKRKLIHQFMHGIYS